eukprot:7748474-Pyramimonas_sp.AAC.1
MLDGHQAPEGEGRGRHRLRSRAAAAVEAIIVGRPVAAAPAGNLLLKHAARLQGHDGEDGDLRLSEQSGDGARQVDAVAAN